MRYILKKIALLAAALMIMAVPVLAEDNFGVPGTEPSLQHKGKECELVAMNCSGGVDSIQDRVNQIQNEINRGTAVYTIEELKRLQQRLDDMNRTADEVELGA
jgi:paraquat-inducible protein B